MWPILFKINNLEIKSYWVFMFLAYFLGGLIFYFLARETLKKRDLIVFILVLALSGFVGARLNYVLLNLDFYLKNPYEILLFYHGGFTSYGGFIGGLIAAFCYLKYVLKQKNEEIKKLFDQGMLAFLFGHSLGRIGCFLNGCCYGKPSASFLSVILPALKDNIFRHPTQLYESFGYFFVYLFLLKKYFKKELNNGLFFGWGLFLHELIRFIVEFFRENKSYISYIFFGEEIKISPAQLASLILIIISLLIINLFQKSKTLKEEGQ